MWFVSEGVVLVIRKIYRKIHVASHRYLRFLQDFSGKFVQFFAGFAGFNQLLNIFTGCCRVGGERSYFIFWWQLKIMVTKPELRMKKTLSREFLRPIKKDTLS